MTFPSGPVTATAPTGGSSLPAEPHAPAQGPHQDPATPLPFLRGSVWAAQVTSVGAHDFVLLVGGLAFDVAGRPPVPDGGALLVVVAEVEPPVFEVVPDAGGQARTAALRALLARLLRHAAADPGAAADTDAARSGAAPQAIAAALQDAARDRLGSPTPELVRYLESGVLRLTLPLAPEAALTRWHVDIADESRAGADGDGHLVTLFADLPALGPVEARLALTSGRLQVLFVVSGDEARRRVLDGRGELEAALAAAGFAAVRVSAEADPARLARDRVADAVPVEAPGPGGLLDVHA